MALLYGTCPTMWRVEILYLSLNEGGIPAVPVSQWRGWFWCPTHDKGWFCCTVPVYNEKDDPASPVNDDDSPEVTTQNEK